MDYNLIKELFINVLKFIIKTFNQYRGEILLQANIRHPSNKACYGKLYYRSKNCVVFSDIGNSRIVARECFSHLYRNHAIP